MSNILVLGSAGFVGRFLTLRLLQNHTVIGYDRCEPTLFVKYDNYHHICGDFCRELNFFNILCNNHVDIIYHMVSTTVPKATMDHLELEQSDNLFPTLRLLEAAVKANVRQMIFSSSGGTIYGEGIALLHSERDRLNPMCSYGIQKMTIESYIELYHHVYGLGYIIARISNPYGVCQQEGRTQGVIPILIDKLQRQEPIVLFGKTVRDYIYIDDVIDALTAFLGYRGTKHIFNIGTGIGTHLYQLVHKIETIMGCDFVQIWQEPPRTCDVMENVLDISRIGKELSWRPSTSLLRGIEKTVEEMV